MLRVRSTWSAVLATLLLCLATQFVREVGAIKATSLKLRTNPNIGLELSKRDYLTSTFRPNNESVFGFFVDVLVGTPPQFFSLACSTSSTTWLPAPNRTAKEFCAKNATGSKVYSCLYDSFFEPNRSSTFTKRRGVLDNFYGDGLFAKGTWGSDVFKINQLSISNISFGLASNWTVAAELGLGVDYNRDLSPYPSIPEVMVNEGAINLILYSIYVNDIRNDGGEIFFGAVDQAKYNGSLSTFDSDKVGQIPVTAAYYIGPSGVNSSLIEQELAPAREIGEIQMGTPALWLPNEVYRALINNVAALTYTTSYDGYTVDCSVDDDQLGTVQFDIDGTIITIPVRQMLVEFPAGSGTCFMTVYQNKKSKTSDPDYVLGTPFLRSAFTVFDWSNNKTSIAQSILNATDSILKEVPEGGIEELTQSSLVPQDFTPTTTSTTSTSTPTATETSTSQPQPGSSTNIGAIVGGSVGGAVGLGVIACLMWFFMRRPKTETDMPFPPSQGPTGPDHIQQNPPLDGQYVQQQYKPQMSVVQQNYGNQPAPHMAQNAPPSAYVENWGQPPDDDPGRHESITSATTYAPATDLSSFTMNGNPRMSGHYNNYPEMPSNRYDY